MKIYIGADHNGEDLKDQIYDHLTKKGYDIYKSKLINNASDDYPDFAFDIAKNVLEEEENIGILLCGNGIGISIAANKVKGIRCARVVNNEDAHHAKNHNGANVIALGGLSLEETLKIIETFINTESPNEERHLRRIDKINKFERGEYNGI